MNELKELQQVLKIGKDNVNEYAGFNYRSATGILEAAKPHLKRLDCYVTIQDELVMLGDRFYMKAVITLINKEGVKHSTNGFARETESEKGKNAAQITGGASSYAHKYGLQNLFLIDDSSEDPDGQDNRPEPVKKPAKAQPAKKPQAKKPAAKANPALKWLDEGTEDWNNVQNYIFDDDNPVISRIEKGFKLNGRVRAALEDFILKKHMK